MTNRPLPRPGALLGAVVDDGDDDTGHRLGSLLEGYLSAEVAAVFAVLAIPDHIGDGTMAVSELARVAELAEDPLSRLMSAAAVYDLVTVDPRGNVTLTACGTRLRTDVPDSVRHSILGFCWRIPALWEGVGQLSEIIRTGEPGRSTTPDEVWKYFQREESDALAFRRSMDLVCHVLIDQMRAAGYTLPACERLVDVGGGRGLMLSRLLPEAVVGHAVLFDCVDRSLAAAEKVLSDAGVRDRVDIVNGDFLVDIPAGDAHLVSQVLHDWDDEHVRTILRNCHRAGRAGGTLVVVDQLLPSDRVPSTAHVMDLMMMSIGPGRERTIEHFTGLARSAGYEFVRDVPTTGRLPWHILEFRWT
jgi:ubiquinone/menaquinone biosynthesis C-methylase UbiE